LDYQKRVHSSDYDQHVPDSPLLPNWNHFLVLREDIQEVDKGLEST
jgi:hypothetical protein